MKFTDNLPPKHIQELIKATASEDLDVAFAAQHQFAKALQTPLRDAILDGANDNMLFTPTRVKPGMTPRMPLALINPGEEDEYVAFVKAREGRVPEKRVEGDYVMVPTYKTYNAIDFDLDFARDEVYSVVQESLNVMRAGFVKKSNDDSWQTVIAAAVDRNILIYDADATAGFLSKRLFSLARTAMKRNGGGNNSSMNKYQLTDVFASDEAVEDVYNWNLDQIPDSVRRDIFLGQQDGSLTIMNIRLHGMLEFGEDQEYQNFFTNVLGASVQTSDTELAIGLDLKKRNSLYMPMVEELKIFADPTMHRRGLEGYYGWLEAGRAILDNRVVIAMSF